MMLLIFTGCQSNQPLLTAQVPNNSSTIESPASTPSFTPSLISPTNQTTETTPPTIEPTLKATASPETTSTPIQLPTTSPTTEPITLGTQVSTDCLDEAAFFADLTVPDDTLVDPGTALMKTWRVRNTGTCTWSEGYLLVFAKGDLMNGALSSPIPVTAPGEIVDISVDLVAPSRGGQQTGYWQFQNSAGTRFGVGSGGHDYIWVQIQVNWTSPGEEQSPTDEPDSDPGQTDDCSASENQDYENQVLSLINNARESAGLPTLFLNSQLSAAALEHSRDMACADYVDHTGSDGSTWYDRVASHGYANYSSSRENIYVGDPSFGGTPGGAFDWWMNSQVHRDNILYSSISEIGIGYVYYVNSSYGGYYTVVFARP